MFGKNKQSALEELLAKFKTLPDEQKIEFAKAISTVKPEEEVVAEEPKTDTPLTEEPTATEESNTAPTETDAMPDETATEEVDEVEQEANAEDMEEAKDEQLDALKAKLEAFLSKSDSFDERLRKIEQRFEESNEPTKENIGLGKQRTVDTGKNDDELSAADYAKKHAKY